MQNSILNWNDLFLFSQVVEHGGFTMAGDALGLPKSRVSRRIAALEQQAGTRLLHRSSRKLSLTDAGVALHQHCLNMLNEAQAGLEALQVRQSKPTGQLRVSMPVELAVLFSASLLPRFMAAYPGIRLTLIATNRSLDLVEDRIDVAVRGLGVESRLEASSLVQTYACASEWINVCSPKYLGSVGKLEQPEDLAAAEYLSYVPNKQVAGPLKLLATDDRPITVETNIRLESNDLAVLKQAALGGLGIAGLPLYLCQDDLDTGRLVQVLKPWRPSNGQLLVIFPSRRGMSAAARTLVEFLKANLGKVVA